MSGTHTYVECPVSAAAYDEIAAKLREAGYDHAFSAPDGAIDMHGIGLTRLEPEPSLVCGIISAEEAERLANEAGSFRSTIVEFRQGTAPKWPLPPAKTCADYAREAQS